MRTFLKILTGIILFALLALTYASYAAETLLSDKERYLKSILTEEFDKTILGEVEENLRDEGDQFALDYDKLWQSVDKDALTDYVHSYTSAFLSSVLNNTKFEFSDELSTDSVRAEIRRQITELGDEVGLNDGEINEDTETIYSYIKKDIDSSVKYIPSVVTNNVDKIRAAVNKVKPYTVYGKWFLIAAAVTTVLLAFISMYKKGFFAGAFYVVLPYWFASTLVFVPSVMFSLYDSVSKITISKSAIYYILAGVLKTVEKYLLDTTALFFAVTTVLVFVFAYLLIYKSVSEKPLE